MQRGTNYDKYVPDSMKVSSMIKRVKENTRSVHDTAPQQPLHDWIGYRGITSVYQTKAQPAERDIANYAKHFCMSHRF